jgi:hypothetical protein
MQLSLKLVHVFHDLERNLRGVWVGRYCVKVKPEIRRYVDENKEVIITEEEIGERRSRIFCERGRVND